MIDDIGPILAGICDGVDSKTLESVAEAAIRAAARPLPIEDAPKDGRFLLINGMKNGDFCEAKWFSKHNVWKIRNGNFVCNEDVTGWLPIPTQESD